MSERDPAPPVYSLEARRKAARRTAWAMALIALAIFVAFMLKGILGR
ncbi:hypothetical protein [Solilutibacter pythonis]|nr:hypothetical protein [Lysobacter pythonis]